MIREKDAFYFSHDSNAKDDPKISMLIEQLGLEGYGIYWVLVETLRDQKDYRYPLDMLPVLARKYNTTHEKIKVVVGNYGLFVIDELDFFSISLWKRMNKMEKIREQNRINGLKSGASRRKVSILNAGLTERERLFNGGSTTVEQRNERKENEINIINENCRDAVDLSDFLRSKIMITKPNSILVGGDNWVNCFEQMIREGFDPDAIAETIEFASGSAFWCAKVTNAEKVRKHFATIQSQLKGAHNA